MLIVRRGDVLSSWAGIRPLVRDPNSSDTQSIARNHIIDVSPSKLITIAGGKWTTYRSMAEETVDKAIKVVNKFCLYLSSSLIKVAILLTVNQLMSTCLCS